MLNFYSYAGWWPHIFILVCISEILHNIFQGKKENNLHINRSKNQTIISEAGKALNRLQPSLVIKTLSEGVEGNFHNTIKEYKRLSKRQTTW